MNSRRKDGQREREIQRRSIAKVHSKSHNRWIRMKRIFIHWICNWIEFKMNFSTYHTQNIHIWLSGVHRQNSKYFECVFSLHSVLLLFLMDFFSLLLGSSTVALIHADKIDVKSIIYLFVARWCRRDSSFSII